MLEKQRQPTCKLLSQLSALPLSGSPPAHPNTLSFLRPIFYYQHLLVFVHLKGEHAGPGS